MANLHHNSKVDIMASGAKIPVSAMTCIEQQADASSLPILVNVNNIYEENLCDPEECFVLVDNRSMRVMSSSSAVHQLLSHQDDHQETTMSTAAEKTVHVMQMDGSKALEIMNDRDKETIEVMKINNRTVEVVPLEDGKSVEVVQMDGEKNLEVMQMDAVKHSEVIHVDGSSSIELLSVETSPSSGHIMTSSSPSMFRKREDKYTLSSQVDGTSIFAEKSQSSSENTISPVSLSLSSLAPVNSSFVLTAPKNNLISGHPFAHMSTITTLASSRQSQVLENDLESLTQVTPSIILSESKKGIASTVDGLDNTILISWPDISTKLDNSVETQTEPYFESGPSFNIFFCTFHQDGSVETQCDMPILKDASVSTHVKGTSVNKGLNHSEPGAESSSLLTEGIKDFSNEAGPKFSKNGRPFKLRDSLFKLSGNDFDFDLEDTKNDLNSTYNMNKRCTPLKKKRGRKRKKRFPSNDDYDYDLDFDGIGNEGNETFKEEIKQESDIKEETTEFDNELASNILKTKGYGLRTKRRLKKLSDMHYMDRKVVKKKIIRIQNFPCQLCKDVFPNFTSLQRHAKVEHDSTDFSFPCEHCGVVFTRPHNLDRHKETKHGNGEKRFVCNYCGRRFGRQDSLSVHISLVHLKKSIQNKSSGSVSSIGSSNYRCTGCLQFFSKESSLLHHREGDYFCNECNIRFECKVLFQSHQFEQHEMSCSECGKVCHNRQQMYVHRLSHDPKYVCSICQKGFLWKAQFTVHMATHTGDKPVLCDICGKAFAHKVAVNKHKWQEHDERNKKFKCATCGKCFVYKGKLQSHMRSHTGEKPFMCHLCPASFSQRCNLTAHIKSVHGVYIQSIKSDGTTQTQLVKYKRSKKQSSLEAQSATVVNAVMAHSVETSVSEQPQIAIQEQVQMSDSFETEAAVYQIVYAYQQ